MTIVSGHMTIVSGHMTIVSGHMTIVSGHMTIVYGHMTIVSGHMTIVSGHMTIVSGHMTIVSGHMTIVSGPFKPSRCIKASFYIPENRLNFSTTKDFRPKISTKLVYQYMVIFLIFQTTSNHLHPPQVENCDSNWRLVVDEDDYRKFRLERVKSMRTKFDRFIDPNLQIYCTLVFSST